MRVSRLISTTNWRYAVGEVFLIVVGVTIALAATSWYEDRQERQNEILVLKQLQLTLSEDLKEINDTWEMTRQRERNLMALVEHLDSGRPYSPELGVKFQSLLGWRIVSINRAPFEALKVGGYQVISNVTLRKKLISFYEDQYQKLEQNLLLDRDFAIEKVQPYFFRNFDMHVAAAQDVDRGAQDWVPKDYEKIRAEGQIVNLCRYRADILRRFVLRHYETTTTAIHEILEIIDQDLDRSR